MTPTRKAALAAAFPEARFDVELADELPFGVSCVADAFVDVDDPDRLDALAELCRKKKLDLLLLGDSPNVLALPGGVPGVVARLGPACWGRLVAGATAAPQLPGGRPPGAVVELFEAPKKAAPVDELVGDLGMRGIRLRSARLSDRDGGYVVNEGEATARDVLTLRDYVRERVRKEWGVKLRDRLLVVGRERSSR